MNSFFGWGLEKQTATRGRNIIGWAEGEDLVVKVDLILCIETMRERKVLLNLVDSESTI